MSTTYHLSDKALALPIFSDYEQKLTKSDVIIANFIAANVNRVIEMSISDLANETSTSEMTVSRFCRKFNLAGFQALKVAIASTGNLSDENIEIDKTDDTKTIVSKIFKNIEEGLRTTQNLLDCEALDNAAKMIADADRLMVFGFGTSGTVCRDVGIRFVRFGLPVEYITDPHQQSTIAAMCKKQKTVVVVVSLSGSSIDLIQGVKIAKNNGAKVILISSHKRSPLASLADVVLLGRGPEIKLLAESTVTRLAYLAIVDVLFTRIAILKDGEYVDNIKGMRNALAPLKS